MATVMTLAPLVGVARVLTEPDPTDALFFAALMIIACGVGASVFIPARRKIVFSKRGIEVIGVPRLVMRWVDVDAIDVPEGALLGSMQFKNANGRKIGVDATMVGWPQLIKHLPDLCADEATNKVTDALAKLR